MQHSRSLRLNGDYLDGIRVDMDDQIKPTALEWGSSRERRAHRRKKCLLPAQLITNAGSYDCRVLDLSKAGAKLETRAVVNPEQAVTLVVKSIGTFAGLVAWRSDGLFGMRFLAQHGTRSFGTASLLSPLRVAEKSQSEPRPGAPVPMPERSFALHDGDVVCVLRKKSNGQDSGSESLETPGQRKKLAGSEFATFVEIGARDFLELAEQKWACTMTFMRVVPSRRQRTSG